MSLVDGSGALFADFTVKQGTVDLPVEFVVRHTGTTDLPTRFYLMRTAKITGPIIVTTSNYDAAIRYGVMTLSFFAAGRHWMFYNHVTGSPDFYPRGNYRSSVDGITWSSATYIGEYDGAGCLSAHFDGTYLHYARIRSQILYYRRGIPNVDGTITWSAAEQTVIDNAGSYIYCTSIAVLSGGYPAIAYHREEPAQYLPRAIISDNNDGTWSGLETDTTLNNYVEVWAVSLHTFGSGLYVLYARDENNILGREYSGGAWQSEEDTGYTNNARINFSAVVKNGEIHVAFIDDADRNIYHGYRTVGGVWQSGVLVQTGTFTNSAVGICVTANTVYIFWADSDEDVIYYRKSLDNGATWTDEASNNAPQKFLDSPEATYGYDFQIYEVRMGGHIGMMWRGGTISPYTIYFADIGPLSPSGLNLFSKLFVGVDATRDLYAEFDVGQGSEALYAKFEVAQWEDLYAKFEVTHSENLYAKFEAQATAFLKGIFETAQWGDLKGIFVARQASIVALKGVLIVRHTATKSLYAKFTTQAIKDLKGIMVIRHSSGYPEANIKCTFSLYKPYANLFSKIRVRGAGTAELKAVFRVTAESLPATFHVGQDSETLHGFFHVGQDSAKLKGVFDVGQNHGEIYAKFEAQAVKNLYAKFKAQPCALLKAIFIVKQGIGDLYAKFEAQATANLYAKFTPKHSASNALKAEFEMGLMLNQSLKAVFIVKQEAESLLAIFRVRSTVQDMYNLIGYNMPELLNDVENIGRGFIGSPAPLQTESGAVKAVSSRGAAQYKEIRFGWRKEDPVYDVPPCVGERDYEDLIYEPWDWDERSYITSVTADTHIRLRFARHFGNSGWTLGNINYATVDYLKASYFDYVYPGDCWDKYVNLDDEESFIRFNIGIPSLDRLGYARFEWFRYYGSNFHQLMGLRRIASCEEVPETYYYWNPANVIGGCDHIPLKNNMWSETALRWDNSGRNNLGMGGGQPYMGLAAFVNNNPVSYYGLTAENNEWDMFEITELLEGWVNGDFKNNGIGIRGEKTCSGWDYRCSNRVNANTARFYSSRSSDTRKPRIMLQYIPENSIGKWSFRGNNYWEIDTDDPLVEGGSLRLRDWSKRNYQNNYEIKPAVTFNTSKTLKEGAIETWIKINRDDWPELRSYDQDRCETCRIDYTTPRDNYIDIFFRYQDSNNHFKVRINPRSRVSKLIETINGYDHTRETWTTAINVGEKKHIRIFWALNDEGELTCCGQMWNTYLEIWRTFFAYTGTPYADEGGDVRIETWDATFDDTKILEVSS